MIAVPHRSCSLQLDGNVRLGRRDVGLVELHRGAGERRGRIAALALDALLGPVARLDCVRIMVGCEFEFHVRLFFRIGDDDGVSGRFGALESVRDRERDVLAIIANDIVLEGGTPFYANAFISLPGAGTENFADVFAMKDRAHARHLFSSRRV